LVIAPLLQVQRFDTLLKVRVDWSVALVMVLVGQTHLFVLGIYVVKACDYSVTEGAGHWQKSAGEVNCSGVSIAEFIFEVGAGQPHIKVEEESRTRATWPAPKRVVG
jgi:hypothetical protein